MAQYRPKFLGRVDVNGDLIIDIKDIVNYKQCLLNFKGMPVTVVIDKVRKARSDNQNRYYWAVICADIAKSTGHTAEEIHSCLAMQFLSMTDAKGFTYVRSTTSLSTAEMEKYLSDCRYWAKTYLNLYIAKPNEIDMEY